MRRVIGSILPLAVMVLLISGCGSRMYTDKEKPGFTFVKDVDGVSFAISKELAGTATATTNISEGMDFERDQAYVYKDGGNSYIMFRISDLVVAAEKGTKFNMQDAEDKLAAVKSESLLSDIWFDKSGRKFECDENLADGIYKFIGTVNAEVVVTSETYNDFTGKLVLLSDGSSEWTLFIGAAGDDYSLLDKNTKDAIEYMASSFQMADTALEEYIPAVQAGGNDISDDSQELSGLGDEAEESLLSSDKGSTETISTEEKESEEDAEDEVIIVEDDGVAGLNEDGCVVSQDDGKEENADSEVSSGPVALNLSNQKNTVREDDKVYQSDIYDMLSLNKWGYASVYDRNAGEYRDASVRLKRIIAGDEAVKYIGDNFDDSYFEAPAGCSWAVGVFDLGKGDITSDVYMNINMKGVDGNDLRFRGIKYPHRTYDINSTRYETIVFYAVPNGCQEYALECGEGKPEDGVNRAYFIVKVG